MIKEKAIEFAQGYLDELNKQKPLHPDYRWIISEPQEHAHYWYFNYKYEPIKKIAEQYWLQFGGAPGYTISKKSGKVRTIGWEELATLKRKDKK